MLETRSKKNIWGMVSVRRSPSNVFTLDVGKKYAETQTGRENAWKLITLSLGWKTKRKKKTCVN